MKVFIGWSGERSKQAAKVFDKYLPNIIQECDTFFSEEMEKGSKWFSEICEELRESEVGIFCLTSDNIKNKWVLFEAGAMAMSLGTNTTRACPFLLDLNPTDLEDPLAQFQLTKNEREDIYKLIETVNSHLEDPIEDSRLKRIFEKWWSDIEKELKKIPESTSEEKTERSQKDILEEVLRKIRNLEKVSTKTEKEKPKKLLGGANELDELVKVKKRFRFKGEVFEKGDIATFTKNIAKEIIGKGFGEKLIVIEEPDYPNKIDIEEPDPSNEISIEPTE